MGHFFDSLKWTDGSLPSSDNITQRDSRGSALRTKNAKKKVLTIIPNVIQVTLHNVAIIPNITYLLNGKLIFILVPQLPSLGI